MKILAIWGENDVVFSKGIQSKKELKRAKHKGKKPNRLIVHQRDIDMNEITEKALKENVSRAGIVITTSGRCIYDGKRNALKRGRL